MELLVGKRFRHILKVLGLALPLICVLAGCGYLPQRGEKPYEGMQPANQSLFDAVDQPYTLDTGDRVRIMVVGQPDITNVYALDQSGQVSVPMVGLIDARQLTAAELEKRVADRLRGILREPKVTVEVESYRPFFILGEVMNSGQYPYVNGMTAQTAVAIAGGFNWRARQSSVEITRSVSGELIRATVPLYQPIRPGDTIRVHTRWLY
jgi:polysaccharide export outer membrane protein